ncbi:MAG TPA: hypothetical protein VMT18_08920 [Planctomycetota bacterium]|nr:hypothetical protein [Planctomycetota bacterium]
MKNVLFGLALAAITFACASEPKASVSENAAPKAECEAKSECSDEAMKACSDKAKAECSDKAKAECASEAKTCPVTGQQIN